MGAEANGHRGNRALIGGYGDFGVNGYLGRLSCGVIRCRAELQCRRAFLRARSTANSNFAIGKKNNQKLPRNRSTSSSSEENVGNSYFKEKDRAILVQ